MAPRLTIRAYVEYRLREDKPWKSFWPKRAPSGELYASGMGLGSDRTNKVLFHILADVYGGYHGIKVLSKARGYPEDMSPSVVRSILHYGDDVFNSLQPKFHPSWLLMSEIEAYDWGAPCPWDSEQSLREASDIEEFLQYPVKPLVREHGSNNVRLVFYFQEREKS